MSNARNSWPRLLAAVIVVAIGILIDYMLTIPPGVLHTLIPFAFVVTAALVASTVWTMGPWQSWAFFIFFTFKMFEPRDRRWFVIDLIGFAIITYAVLTKWGARRGLAGGDDVERPAED